MKEEILKLLTDLQNHPYKKDLITDKIIELKNEKMKESLIPKGKYCYDKNRPCVYFSQLNFFDEKGDIIVPYCAYLKAGSINNNGWNNNEFKRLQKLLNQTEDELWNGLLRLDLLWDMVKECGINNE